MLASIGSGMVVPAVASSIVPSSGGMLPIMSAGNLAVSTPSAPFIPSVATTTSASTDSSQRRTTMGDKQKTFLSLDLEQPPSKRSGGRGGRAGAGGIIDTKVFVVWLESYEDYENFPAGQCVEMGLHIKHHCTIDLFSIVCQINSLKNEVFLQSVLTRG